MSWIVPKLWPESTCFIIGGGPSLALQAGLSPSDKDPEIVFPAVRKHLIECYGLDRFRTIGVNCAFKLGEDLVDVLWFGDCGFFDRNFVEIAKFSGLKAHCCKRLANRPGTLPITRIETEGLTSDPRKIHWNESSGASAINLAVHFGAKRIILMGYDMKFGSDKKFNWHDEHKHGERMKKRKALQWNPFPRFLKQFKIIQRDAKKMGVEILNATSDSALTIFPNVRLEDVIHELESTKTLAR